LNAPSYPRKLELFLVGFFALVVVGALVYVRFPHIIGPAMGYTGCFTKTHLGILCPTCGGTRAVAFLLEGQFVQALQANFLMVFSVPLALYYGIKSSLLVIRGRGLMDLRIDTRVLWIWLAVTMIFTVLRNIL